VHRGQVSFFGGGSPFDDFILARFAFLPPFDALLGNPHSSLHHQSEAAATSATAVANVRFVRQESWRAAAKECALGLQAHFSSLVAHARTRARSRFKILKESREEVLIGRGEEKRVLPFKGVPRERPLLRLLATLLLHVGNSGRLSISESPATFARFRGRMLGRQTTNEKDTQAGALEGEKRERTCAHSARELSQ